MAHWTKSFRRYERHFLLGLVILLLASFSVTGALKRCGQESTTAPAKQLGGSFQVSPKKRMEVSDAEMIERADRHAQFARIPGNDASLTYEEFGRARPERGLNVEVKRAWLHIVGSEAAREAGFRVGEGQLASAIKAVMARAEQMGGMQRTRESYEHFLNQFYQGPASSFEKTLRAEIARDEFLSSLVEPARFAQTYAEAYETWKATRERVDLRSLAFEASSFAAEVLQEELTRVTLSKQQDPLDQVWLTAGLLRTLQGKIEDYKKNKGEWPASLEVLAKKEDERTSWAVLETQLKDSWGNPFVTVREGDGLALSSTGPSGPEGKAGAADDLTPAFQLQIDAHRRLARVANALVHWYRGAEPSAWPESLLRLTQPPPKPPAEPGKEAARLPPLASLEKDPWGQDFVYTPGAAGAPPALASAGPDGKPGTADDIVATIETERARVTPGPAFTPFVDTTLRDSWDRPLHIHINPASLAAWEVASDGKDGVAGTSDDILTGNRGEFERFWAEGAVKSEFRLPIQRQFQALVMHLPLVSDERLRRLWVDYPDLRPTKEDEDNLFSKQWLLDHGPASTYAAVDPRDPERGHGAAFAKRMWPDRKVWLVPHKDVFLVPAAPPAIPAPAAPEPAPAPAPASPDGAAPAPAPPAPPDPQRREYEEKGWREVLLRQEFLERVLAREWQEVVKSHQALRDWEQRGIRATARPEVRTLKDVLEKFAKYQPTPEEAARGERFLELVERTQPISVKEMDAIKEIGDPRFSSNPHVGSLREAGPASIPIQLNERLTKVLFFNDKYEPERTPNLDKEEEKATRAKVFERYVERRAMARAETELQAFQRDVEKRQAVRKENETDDGIWAAALAAWKEAHPGVVVHDERTGMFIGSRPPQRRAPAEDAAKDAAPLTDEQKAARARALRRDFVRESGYLQVRPSDSGQDATTAKVGTFGRKTLSDPSQGDEATHSAYLVRVADHAFPTKAEFSPRAYANELRRYVFGDTSPGARSYPRGDHPGAYPQALAAYLYDIDRLRALFDLRTRTNLDQLGR
jgi:hypothetical protein